MSAELIVQPPLIAHVIYSLGAGGLENGLVNIINRIPENRYRHAIICLTESGSFEERIKNSTTRVYSLHTTPGHSFRIYWTLWKTLRQLEPSIVHTRNLSALEAQIPAFFLTKRVKTVHGVHGRDVFDLEGKKRKYNLLRKMIRPLVGRYITVSLDLKRWLVNTIGVNKEKVLQIYNGVDQSLFKPGKNSVTDIPINKFLPQEPIVIGTVGRLAEVKDQATLIRAFSTVLEASLLAKQHLRLVIAGNGPMMDQLEMLISELGLGDFVWMAGDRNDIPEILRLLNIFVLPSIGEGRSNTILEAMATGLPIIATNVGGNPELVEDGVNGYLVPPGNPEKLAERIIKLTESSETRSLMGKVSLKKVHEKFNWDSTVENYLSVYDELLNNAF
jgi:sugar transferase (PEP-CTERM/EpsH1 system associated)